MAAKARGSTLPAAPDSPSPPAWTHCEERGGRPSETEVHDQQAEAFSGRAEESAMSWGMVGFFFFFLETLSYWLQKEPDFCLNPR